MADPADKIEDENQIILRLQEDINAALEKQTQKLTGYAGDDGDGENRRWFMLENASAVTDVRLRELRRAKEIAEAAEETDKELNECEDEERDYDDPVETATSKFFLGSAVRFASGFGKVSRMNGRSKRLYSAVRNEIAEEKRRSAEQLAEKDRELDSLRARNAKLEWGMTSLEDRLAQVTKSLTKVDIQEDGDRDVHSVQAGDCEASVEVEVEVGKEQNAGSSKSKKRGRNDYDKK